MTPTVEAESREAWVLVPREPTDEMLEAMDCHSKRVPRENGRGHEFIGLLPAERYRAMIAAAPSPTTGGVETSDAIERLVDAIKLVDQHVQAVQRNKALVDAGKEADTPRAIIDAMNALPGVLASLRAAESDIEAAFEAYEDQIDALASPPPIAGPSVEQIEDLLHLRTWIDEDGTVRGFDGAATAILALIAGVGR